MKRLDVLYKNKKRNVWYYIRNLNCKKLCTSKVSQTWNRKKNVTNCNIKKDKNIMKVLFKRSKIKLINYKNK